MVKLLDISVSNNWEKKSGHRKGRPVSRAQRSAQRQERRKTQELIYIDEPFLGYKKNSFGHFPIHKGFFNEGFDFKNKIIEQTRIPSS